MIETAKIEEEESKSHGIESVPLPVGRAIECMSPETLAHLGLPLIRTIARVASPRVIYPAVQQLKDEDPSLVEECLGTEAALAEVPFWDLASKMHIVQENGGVETLQADGHQFQKEEDQSTFLARVLLEKPEQLGVLVSNLLERNDGDFVGKTFHVFLGCLSSSAIVERMAKLKADQVRCALIRAFEGKGYGDFCQVIPAGKGNNTGFLINRGARRTTNAVLDREEKRRFRDDRRLKTDAIFVVPETGTLWVHCAKNDAQTYANVLSELIENRQAFGRRQSFDLSTFLRKDVGSELLRLAQQAHFVRAEIRFVEIVLADESVLKKSSGRGRCLTETFYQTKTAAIHIANQMRVIKLRLVTSSDGKQYTDVEIKSGSLKIGPGVDPLVVSQFLNKLGVWKAYDNC